MTSAEYSEQDTRFYVRFNTTLYAVDIVTKVCIFLKSRTKSIQSKLLQSG